MIGKVKRQSQASSSFSATCIMQLFDGKKERTIDVVPMIKGDKVSKGF